MNAEIEAVADILATCQRLVVSTGAGISKESGIPTFREAHDGLWAKYDPTMLATPQAFARNPKLVWDWYQYRLDLIEQAQPNAGHHALVALEQLLPQVIVITQNIDGFHDKVGSSDVISLHGSIRRYKCFENCQGSPTLVDLDSLTWDDSAPPLCPHCQSAYLRPDVVWFTEVLPANALRRAQQEALACDVMLVVGTSGLVQPAASLPFIAAQNGATVVEVNPAPSQISQIAKVRIPTGAAVALPHVVQRIENLLQS